MPTGDVTVEDESIRDRIQSMHVGLTRADQRIAGAILADYPMTGLKTLVDLGKETSSSPATVLRFIGKLGFTGYPQFQKALRDELQTTLDSPLSRYHSEGRLKQSDEPLAQYAGYATELLQETVQMLQQSELETVISLLAEKRRPIHLVGGRYSRSLAELFGYGLSSIRPGVRVVDDDHRAMVGALGDIGKRDIVIAFDFRRYQTSVQSFVEQAIDAGARVILFTDRWRSLCAPRVHHCLALPVASPSVFDSGLSALLCIEAMVAALAERLGDAGEAHIVRVETLYRRLGQKRAWEAE